MCARVTKPLSLVCRSLQRRTLARLHCFHKAKLASVRRLVSGRRSNAWALESSHLPREIPSSRPLPAGAARWLDGVASLLQHLRKMLPAPFPGPLVTPRLLRKAQLRLVFRAWVPAVPDSLTWSLFGRSKGLPAPSFHCSRRGPAQLRRCSLALGASEGFACASFLPLGVRVVARSSPNGWLVRLASRLRFGFAQLGSSGLRFESLAKLTLRL